MGFFSFLFRRPFYIGDAFFGRLRRDDFDAQTGYACFVAETLLFGPTGQHISCCLDATEAGPTPSQRDFFQHIERQYHALEERVIPLFEECFRCRNPLFRIHHFATEFQLTNISIPVITSGQKGPVAWEWSFSSVHDTIHTFTIYMHGDTPEPTVLMDG